MAEFVSDLYVAEGYATGEYVADTYVNPGYVTGIVTGSVSMSTACGITASPSRTILNSANLNNAFAASLSASVKRQGTVLKSSTATLSTQATKTVNPNINLSTQVTQTTQGFVTRPGTVLKASTATLSAQAIRYVNTTATLNANGHDAVTWENYGAWNHDTQQIWGPTVSVSAIKYKGGSATLSTQANLSASTSLIRASGVIKTTFATVTADGKRYVGVSATLSGLASQLSAGSTETKNQATLSSNFAINVEPFVGKIGSATLNSALDFQLNANVKQNGVSLQAGQATLSANGTRIVRDSVSKQTVANLVADGTRIRNDKATLASNTNLSASGISQYIASASLQTQASIETFGTILLTGSATLNAFTSTLSAITIYRIDPYRVYSVDTESRTLIIEAEPRKFMVIPENRLNTVEQETRGFTVKSETRILKPQTLSYVEVSGNPLDRRQG